MDLNAIIDSALARCSEVRGEDTEIDMVAKDGINEGYRMVAQRVDKQTNSTSVAYASMITLPTNAFEVYEVYSGSGILLNEEVDYESKGRELKIINTDYQSGTIKINYYEMPALLSLGTDVPVVSEQYHNLLAIFGAYAVMLYKKKLEVAQMLQAEFMNLVGGEDGEL